jgi:hypothetical protein
MLIAVVVRCTIIALLSIQFVFAATVPFHNNDATINLNSKTGATGSTEATEATEATTRITKITRTTTSTIVKEPSSTIKPSSVSSSSTSVSVSTSKSASKSKSPKTSILQSKNKKVAFVPPPTPTPTPTTTTTTTTSNDQQTNSDGINSKSSNTNTNTSKKLNKNNTMKPKKEEKYRQRTLMDYESISLALRLTCEMNRKLLSSTKPRRNIDASATKILQQQQQQQQPQQHQHQQQQHDDFHQDYQHNSQHHPQQHQQQQQQPFMQQTTTTSPTNIFNSQNKHHQQLKSNLSTYVQLLSKILGYGTNPIIPAIAMIYLDRACSMSTGMILPGTDIGAANANVNDNVNTNVNANAGTGTDASIDDEIRCPYLTSQTVHKLYLTAIILACRTVRNEYPMNHHDGYYDDYTLQYVSLIRTYCNDIKNNVNDNDDDDDDDNDNIDADDVAVLKEIMDSTNINLELGSWLEHMVSSLKRTNGMIISSDEVDWFLHQWSNLFEWENVSDNTPTSSISSISGEEDGHGHGHGHGHGSIDQMNMQKKKKNSNGSSSSSSSSSSSTWEEGFELLETESSSSVNDEQDGYYVQQDNNNRMDEYFSGSSSSSSSSYNSGGHHYQQHEQYGSDGFHSYYEREEIHYSSQSQQGNPSLGDGGDMWWSA